jgi:hypothetical protein
MKKQSIKIIRASLGATKPERIGGAKILLLIQF